MRVLRKCVTCHRHWKRRNPSSSMDRNTKNKSNSEVTNKMKVKLQNQNDCITQMDCKHIWGIWISEDGAKTGIIRAIWTPLCCDDLERDRLHYTQVTALITTVKPHIAAYNSLACALTSTNLTHLDHKVTMMVLMICQASLSNIIIFFILTDQQYWFAVE